MRAPEFPAAGTPMSLFPLDGSPPTVVHFRGHEDGHVLVAPPHGPPRPPPPGAPQRNRKWPPPGGGCQGLGTWGGKNEDIWRLQPLATPQRTERRRHDRVPSNIKGVVSAGDAPTDAVVLDVSESGVRCEVQHPFGIGEEVEVAFELADGHLLRTRARVVRVELGLEFDDLSPISRDRLDHHLQDARRRTGRGSSC